MGMVSQLIVLVGEIKSVTSRLKRERVKLSVQAYAVTSNILSVLLLSICSDAAGPHEKIKHGEGDTMSYLGRSR